MQHVDRNSIAQGGDLHLETIADSLSPEPFAKYTISPFLTMVRRPNGSRVAYHALFGNTSVLDPQCAEALESVRDSVREITFFEDIFGREVTEQLFSAHYLGQPGEDREIAEQWLKARRDGLEEGRHLGGLQITSSNACNFSCSYCFADSSDSRSPKRQSAAGIPNISFETACQAIDAVLGTAGRHGRSRIGVKFLGREPLVNYKVMDRLFARYGRETVAWSLTTNGSLITSEIAARLAEMDTRVVVSIDGLPAVNDALRKVKSKQGEQSAYVLAMRGLDNLIGAGVHASVSSVVSSQTDFAAMPEFLREVRRAGCREIELTLVMQTDSLRLQGAEADNDVLAASLIGLYHEAQRLGLSLTGDWIDPYNAILANHKFRDEADIARPGGAGCQATEHQISVEPNGDLFPCRAMSLHYGSLDAWQDVLASDAYRKVVMRTFYAVPYCQGCPLEGHCQGTCLGSLEEESGDIYNPQADYCDLYRSVTARLLGEIVD